MLGYNVFPYFTQPYNTQFNCYSVALLPGNEREDVENGGKIIMPPSALEHLTKLQITYPMLFRLYNAKYNRLTHCGVLEFVADEDNVYIPNWMMQNLMLDEGDIVEIEAINLPMGIFTRFQPHSADFLDITNPKAVLENCLRNFACLTTGDVINIKYNDKDYKLSVLETRPGLAVSIIECDMDVEFTAPIGYQEPNKPNNNTIDEQQIVTDSSEFYPFTGKGHRLDGKPRKDNDDELLALKIPQRNGIPDYDWKLGSITFMRNVRKLDSPKIDRETDFEAFSGMGYKLSKNKSKD
ncbi:hypothetical protein O3M35_009912 [Rhynocoris fuscipes]|uniref:Ubiquitin fusion degradation protein 1 homolog n=1 Tax=Rhynocoris fuscipes TaxID=488301 RepID=A0AAW1D5Y7_9HEMI